MTRRSHITEIQGRRAVAIPPGPTALKVNEVTITMTDAAGQITKVVFQFDQMEVQANNICVDGPGGTQRLVGSDINIKGRYL